MGQWSKAELEALWATTNPGNGNPHLMAAIALAESGGNDQNVNSIGACGLWQIHPYEAGCQNPRINAQQAGRKLHEQGLTAWESYTNGSYKQFDGGGSTGGKGGYQSVFFGIPFTPSIPGESIPEELLEGKVPNPAQPFEQAFGFLKGFAELFPKIVKWFKFFFSREGWIRIGKVLVGLFLLLTGVLGMAKIDATQAVTKGVSKGAKAVEFAK
jgi:Transglycosylase SLT domain